MDSSALVNNGHVLVKGMDAAGFPPRLAMWVHDEEYGRWDLWLVPQSGENDEFEFYKKVAQVIARNRPELGDMDAADTKMVPDTHPAVQGLASYYKLPGLGTSTFSGNLFDGFYLPESIILRSDL